MDSSDRVAAVAEGSGHVLIICRKQKESNLRSRTWLYSLANCRINLSATLPYGGWCRDRTHVSFRIN
jgi:hypothetical protein